MLISHYNRIVVPQNEYGRKYADLFKHEGKITETTTDIIIEFTDYFEVWTDDGNLNSYNITETEYTIAKDSETVDFKNGKNQF